MEELSRPGNPLHSPSTSIPSFFASEWYFPDGDPDVIRYLENEAVPGESIERDLPLSAGMNDPLFVRPFTLREAFMRSWLDHGSVDPRNDMIARLFIESSRYGSYDPGDGKKIREMHDRFGTPLDPATIDIAGMMARGDIYEPFETCLYDGSFDYLNAGGGSTKNKLEKIPSCIGRKPTSVKIKELKVPFNRIRKMEEFDGLKNLRWIDLHGNLVEKIEGLDGLKNLEKISLGLNRIKKIENIDHLKNLKKLRIARNEIRKIENLDGLENLELIDLMQNEIREIENLEGLKNLEHVDLSWNEIDEIKNLEGLDNLKYVDVGRNNITVEECKEFNEEHDEFLLECP